MRKTTALIILILIYFSCSYAQKRFSPQDQANELKNKLGLTDDQTLKIVAIFAENHPKADSLFSNGNLNRADMRGSMELLMNNTDKEIEKVLTGEQKQKYNEYRNKY